MAGMTLGKFMIKVLVFVVGTGVGIGMVYYCRWFYENVSTLPSVERYLGAGGGYSGWRLAGIGVIVLSWIMAFKFI